MIEVYSVVLGIDKLESQEEARAYASFGFLSQSSFRWEQ